MRRLAFAVLVALPGCALLGKRTAPPPQEPAPLWEDAKLQIEGVLERIAREGSPESQRFVGNLRRMAVDVERKERQTRQKRLNFFNAHRVDWTTVDELSRWTEYVFAARMLRLYGEALPTTFNKTFPKSPLAPIRLRVTEAEYEEKFAPVGRGLVSELHRVQKKHGVPEDDLD